MTNLQMRKELKDLADNHRAFSFRKLPNKKEYSFKNESGTMSTGSIEKIYSYLKEINYL
jgi:hypothetical protein